MFGPMGLSIATVVYVLWKLYRIKRDNEMRAKLNLPSLEDREAATGYYTGWWLGFFMICTILVLMFLLHVTWPLVVIAAVAWLVTNTMLTWEGSL